MSARLTGRVTKWSERGFGFIEPNEGQEDSVFVHCTEIHKGEPGFKDLRRNDIVEFSLATGPDGRMRAVDVVVL